MSAMLEPRDGHAFTSWSGLWCVLCGETLRRHLEARKGSK